MTPPAIFFTIQNIYVSSNPEAFFMVIEGLSFGEKIKKYQKQALTYISSDS